MTREDKYIAIGTEDGERKRVVQEEPTLEEMVDFYTLVARKATGQSFLPQRKIYKYIGTLSGDGWEDYEDTPDTTDLAPVFVTRKQGQTQAITHTSEAAALKWAECQAKDDPGVTVETYRIIAQVKARKQPLIMDWVK